MILVVLLQGGNQGGVGAALGGGNSTSAFGATGATSLFGKMTYGAAAVFMISSILLTIEKSGGGNIGLTDELRKEIESGAPATQETPASETPEAEKAPEGEDK